VPADVFEEYDFDTRGQFAGLVRDWKERLEAINPYVPVVPQEGIPSRERERVSELYQAIYADPEKRRTFTMLQIGCQRLVSFMTHTLNIKI
jgi:hypothetical protein